MANDETKTPDRDVEAAAVRALDALARALESFAKLVDAATTATTKFGEIAAREADAYQNARRGRS